MGVKPHRQRYHNSPTLAAVTAIAFLLLAAAASAFGLGPARKPQEYPGRAEMERRLIGPGSWPPGCRSKCGSCTPCRPVHVPVQPGLSEPLEYYPEAWRCKCGNKLFMP
ncbi:hypothetical protein NMG60_11032107 [Bertholletia excelsa]